MSVQVVISLCRRKETAASISKPPFPMGVSIGLLHDGFFSFAVVRQSQNLFIFYHWNKLLYKLTTGTMLRVKVANHTEYHSAQKINK